VRLSRRAPATPNQFKPLASDCGLSPVPSESLRTGNAAQRIWAWAIGRADMGIAWTNKGTTGDPSRPSSSRPSRPIPSSGKRPDARGKRVVRVFATVAPAHELLQKQQNREVVRPCRCRAASARNTFFRRSNSLIDFGSGEARNADEAT
jgi:hypothetical protein